MADIGTLEQIDEDINDLQTRIATLRAHRANLATVLLSQPNLSAHLQTSAAATQDKAAVTVHRLIMQQRKRNTENIYRACAGVTAYKVQDPDPHAINNGNILGVSIDVSLGGKFIDTYHVLLNSKEQDDAGNKVLRIHKHTIPPCIPLQHLALRWLPSASEKESREQDLVRFAKALRKELVSWHLRVQAVETFCKEARTDVRRKDDAKLVAGGTVLNAFVSDDEASSDVEVDEDGASQGHIIDVEADMAVRQITITWSDGRTAILSVTKDGRVDKAVCRMRDGSKDTAHSTAKAVGPLPGLLRRLQA